MTAPTRAALYLRVSTGRQAESDLSIPDQRRQATAYCAGRGWAIAAALGVILSAAYMLWLVQRLFYGPESEMAAAKPAGDLEFREMAVLAPLAVLMLVMGLAPSIWLTSIQTGVHPPQPKEAAVLHSPFASASVTTITSQEEGRR